MRHNTEVEDFIRARYPALLRYATLLTGNRTSGEDLVQDAIVRTYEAWGRIDNPDAYVRRTMYNRSVSRWRSVLRREQVTDHPPEQAVAGVEDALAEHQRLLGAIDHLNMRAKTAVVLRYFEDRPDAEIAEILGTSESGVRTILSRARQQLRNTLTVPEVTR